MLAALEHARISADSFLARVPRDLHERWIHILNGAVGIGNHNDFTGLFNGQGKPFSFRLGLYAFGYIFVTDNLTAIR